MPCRVDAGPGFTNYEPEYTPDYTHNSVLAETFCELCRSLTARGIALTPKAQTWWEAHKKRDELKAQQEERIQKLAAEKQAALDKLTDREKTILGVRGR